MSSCYLSLLCYFFFFSSRRRHTRCLSDWSSDVCSSDLSKLYRRSGLQLDVTLPQRRYEWAAQILTRALGESASDAGTEALQRTARAQRSEERRVGKECGYRGRTYAEKRKNRNEERRASR